MTTIRILALLLLALPSARPLAAQQAEIPEPVARGLEMVREGDLPGAVLLWSATWTGPADAGKSDQLLSGLRPVHEYGGGLRDYDLLGIESVGPHVKRVYLLLRYAALPVYAHFVVYDRGEDAPDWVVTTVQWHTDPSQILPPSVWSR